MIHSNSHPSLHTHGIVVPEGAAGRTNLAISTLAIALLLVATIVWLVAAYL